MVKVDNAPIKCSKPALRLDVRWVGHEAQICGDGAILCEAHQVNLNHRVSHRLVKCQVRELVVSVGVYGTVVARSWLGTLNDSRRAAVDNEVGAAMLTRRRRSAWRLRLSLIHI